MHPSPAPTSPCTGFHILLESSPHSFPGPQAWSLSCTISDCICGQTRTLLAQSHLTCHLFILVFPAHSDYILPRSPCSLSVWNGLPAAHRAGFYKTQPRCPLLRGTCLDVLFCFSPGHSPPCHCYAVLYSWHSPSFSLFMKAPSFESHVPRLYDLLMRLRTRPLISSRYDFLSQCHSPNITSILFLEISI